MNPAANLSLVIVADLTPMRMIALQSDFGFGNWAECSLFNRE